MTRLIRSAGPAILIVFLSAFGWVGTSRAGSDWPPISPEDLAMKDNPASPGAHAMILNREQVIDESDSRGFNYIYETDYVRLKIFTAEGKKYADVAIPFLKDYGPISKIEARTIHSDGRVIPFDGQVFEKTAIKYHDARIMLKSFTLPDVQPGSIIEYRYRVEGYSLTSDTGRWILQDELYMRRASYVLRQHPGPATRWTGRTLHGEQLIQKNGEVQLIEENVRPFREEDFMPPVEEVIPHIEYYYTWHTDETINQYWKRIGKEWNEAYEKFIGKHNEIAEAATQITTPNDSPEVKLRKLYARAQQIRNLSFERRKTEKEEKREKLKENNNAADVLKHGYGYGSEVVLFFVALARAAGFEASAVRVARRDSVFFNQGVPNARQLNDVVAVVVTGSTAVFLDPGTALCPYGLLPWAETAVAGLKPEKDGGFFVTTTLPNDSQSVTERKADLQLDEDGNLQGKLQISFTGLEALLRRQNAREEDDAGRKKEIEDEFKAWLPAGASFDLGAVTGWDQTEQPLTVEGTLHFNGFAMMAGRRLLVPLTFLQSNLAASFQRYTRSYPIYFRYPFQIHDAITIQVPDGYSVETLPDAKEVTPDKRLMYRITAKQQGNSLHVERTLAVNGFLFPTEFYSTLRTFLSSAKASDDQQAIFQSSASAKKN